MLIFLIGLVFAEVINTVAHETSDGILKLTYDKSLTASYESYKTGVYYEHIYTEGGIMEIHPLFILDPSLIKDCIEENTPVLHIDEVVTITYEIEYARRNYVIILEIEQKIYEDVDTDILNLQRQNKVLLKKVYVLTKSVEKLEYKLAERLIEYDNKLIKLDKKIDALIALKDSSLIGHKDITDSYIEMIYRMLTSSNIHMVELGLKIHGNANVYNYLGISPMYNIIEHQLSDRLDYVKIISKLIENGADINTKTTLGKTILSVCRNIFIQPHVDYTIKQKYEELIKYLVANGAAE